MDAEVLLTRLEETDLVDAVGNGDEFRLTEEFHVHLNEYRTKWNDMDDGELRTEFTRQIGEADIGDPLYDSLINDRGMIYTYLTIDDHIPDISIEQKSQLAVVLGALLGEPPRDDGAPAAFLPVKGEALPALLKSYRIAVVYCWREDCNPCDVMKAAFDDLFETAPDDVGLFAVYGPDAARFLHEEYDVEAAPTTLFVFDGEVDSRIIGSRFYEAIEAEIETLRGYVESGRPTA